MRIRVYNQFGTEIADTGLFELGPLQNNGAVVASPVSFMCRFTVPSKSTVRAAASVVPLGSTSVKAVVPAQ